MEDATGQGADVERHDGGTVVRLRGRVAELEAQRLEQTLTAAIEAGASRLVVDLSDVPFITSACLGALMLAHKRLRAKGGALRIARAQPLVRQILETTKLTKLFGLYESVEDALTAE